MVERGGGGVEREGEKKRGEERMGMGETERVGYDAVSWVENNRPYSMSNLN